MRSEKDYIRITDNQQVIPIQGHRESKKMITPDQMNSSLTSFIFTLSVMSNASFHLRFRVLLISVQNRQWNRAPYYYPWENKFAHV